MSACSSPPSATARSPTRPHRQSGGTAPRRSPPPRPCAAVHRQLELPVSVKHPRRDTRRDHGMGQLRLIVDRDHRGTAVRLRHRGTASVPRAAAAATRGRRRNGDMGTRGNGKLSELLLGSRGRKLRCALRGARDQTTRGGARKPACKPSRADFRTKIGRCRNTATPEPSEPDNRRTVIVRSLSTTTVRATARTAAAARSRTISKTGHVDASNVTSENAPASRDRSIDSCTTRKARPPAARDATVRPR